MGKALSSELRNADWHALFQRVLMQNYAPAPVAFVRGERSRLWDAEGKSYLDFAAGVAVCSTGHAHPTVARALAEQARRLIHTSNLFLIPNELQLADKLTQLARLPRAFFCNSGAEAVEGLLKIARLWGHKNGGRHEIITTDNSFHGRTLGALSVTHQKKYQEGFEPLLPGVVKVPFGDAPAVARAVGPKTCAVLVEPIQGEGGVHVPPATYLRDLRRLCDERNLLLLLDEVQTGIGRTGRWFSFEEAGILPDAVALAKGLGSGVPIGAVLCNERAHVLAPGTHGSTFGGNPLATAAALATLRVLEEEQVLANVRKQGAHLLNHLGAFEEQGLVRDVRGAGLLVGFDLPNGDAKGFAKRLLEAGLLVTYVHAKTIRICPPLTIAAAEIEEGLEILARALRA